MAETSLLVCDECNKQFDTRTTNYWRLKGIDEFQPFGAGGQKGGLRFETRTLKGSTKYTGRCNLDFCSKDCTVKKFITTLDWIERENTW